METESGRLVLRLTGEANQSRLTFEQQQYPTSAISTSRWITPGRTPLLNGWKKLPTLGSAPRPFHQRGGASTSPAALSNPIEWRHSQCWRLPQAGLDQKSLSRWARSCAAWGTRRTNTRAKAQAGRNGGGDPQVPHVGGPHLRQAKPQQATAMRAKRLRSQLLFIKKI